MNLRIQDECSRRGITRICHFTPSRNFAHILAGQQGILSTARLRNEERAAFNATDVQRFDGLPDHICCSVEFPNPFYFAVVRNQETLFPDWMILLVRPDYLWRTGTRFCPTNASAANGTRVTIGQDGFTSLYVPSVTTAGGIVITRTISHPGCCPTDLQAEVLVPDNIVQEDMMGVAFSSEAQARAEISRLRLAGLNFQGLKFVISPGLFRRELGNMLRAGQRPVETEWIPAESQNA